MKTDEFKIPCVTHLTKKTYGSLSVTVWPNPSDGQPNICVQGKMYLAFISFVHPLVLKDMQTSILSPMLVITMRIGGNMRKY